MKKILSRISNNIDDYRLKIFYRKVERLGDSLGGMTVNERLYLSGIMEEFDHCKKNDKPKARKILEALRVDEPSINLILLEPTP